MHNILELDKAIVESIDNIKYSTDKDFEYWKKNPYPTITGLDIDWKNLIANPPPNRSEQTKAELHKVQLMSSNLTAEEFRLVHEVDKDPGLLFVSTLQEKNLKIGDNQCIIITMNIHFIIMFSPTMVLGMKDIN